MYRFDVSGGAVAQPLPPIGTAAFGVKRDGGMISVVETTGTTGLTLTPAGADTINGVAGPFAVPGGGGVIIQGDGIGDWRVISVYDPLTSGQPADQTSLTYRELGAANGPLIFNNWDALYAQLLLIRAAASGPTPIDVYVDQTDNPFPAANTVPFTGTTYDLTNVTLRGTSVGGSTLDFADGVSVINMFKFGPNVQVRNRNTVTPLCTIGALFAAVDVNDFSSIETINGGAPFYQITTGSGIRITCTQFSGTNQDTPAQGFTIGPIVGGIVAGKFLQLAGFNINPGRPPFRGDATVFPGAAGGLMVLVVDDFRGLPGTFAGFAGTIFTPQQTGPASLLANPYQAPAATAAVSAIHGNMLRFDASGGPISQALPTISGAGYPFYQNTGGFLTVVESGGGSVTLTPAGGDTINGAASLDVPPGGGVLLESDGISDWRVVASHNPADSGADNVLIYQPFTPAAGPLAFSSWPALIAQLGLMRAVNNGTGLYTIGFRDFGAAPFTPMVIPAGGPYNMRDVTWDGAPSAGGANVHMADGATFTGLRYFDNGIFLRNLNTVTPADDSLGAVGAVEAIFIEGGTDIAGNVGGAPVWGNGSMAPGNFFVVRVRENSNLGNNSGGPIFDIPDGVTLAIVGDETQTIEPTRSDLLVGTAGAVLRLTQAGTFHFKKTYPLWLGTIITAINNPASLLTNPLMLPPAVAPLGFANFGEAYRFDASGGAIAQTLPDISSSATGKPGGQLTVIETGGGQVTLSAAGGDTIAGGASFLVPPHHRRGRVLPGSTGRRRSLAKRWYLQLGRSCDSQPGRRRELKQRSHLQRGSGRHRSRGVWHLGWAHDAARPYASRL
jgi:hypothetical protein